MGNPTWFKGAWVSCPTCKKKSGRGAVGPWGLTEIIEYDTHAKYVFHCGHYRNIKKKGD